MLVDPPDSKIPAMLLAKPPPRWWAWCWRCGGIQPTEHIHSCNRHLDCARADSLDPNGLAAHCNERDHKPICTCEGE